MLESGQDFCNQDFCNNFVQNLNRKSRRHRFNLRSAYLSYRKPSMILVGLACIHIVLVYTVSGGGDQHSPNSVPLADDGAHENTPHRKLLQTVSLNDNPVTYDRPAEINPDAIHQQQSELLSNLPRDQNSGETVIDSSATCRSGHIQGLGPICGNLPCLRQLRTKNVDNVQTIQLRQTSDQLTTETLRKIQYISGQVDPIHYSLVPFVTSMQWSHGVFGTVGEFGASFGKFTSLLSASIDVNSGEKLVVANPFNKSTEASLGFLSHYEIFTKNMLDFGFADGEKKLFVHRGTARNFPKEKLSSDWDVSQFRLVSVDSEQDSTSWMSTLELSACLLRDGGLLIIDGVEEDVNKEMVKSNLERFFSKQGQSTLTPLLTAGNKLYLTTTNWRTRYARYILDNIHRVQGGVKTIASSGEMIFENTR